MSLPPTGAAAPGADPVPGDPPPEDVAQATAPLLEARGLQVGHGDSARLAAFDLTLTAGEVVALTGPSGAGKSTALRALAGLTPLDAGALSLRGEPPEAIGWTRYRRSVHLVLQRPVLLPGSVRDNLRAAFQPAVSTQDFDEGRAAALLEDLGLGGRLEDPADQLSIGEAQRVHLARSLLLAPPVLLLDEPTSALDADNQLRVEDQVTALGAALVLVSHDEAQLARLASRRLELRPPGPAP